MRQRTGEKLCGKRICEEISDLVTKTTNGNFDLNFGRMWRCGYPVIII